MYVKVANKPSFLRDFFGIFVNTRVPDYPHVLLGVCGPGPLLRKPRDDVTVMMTTKMMCWWYFEAPGN